MNVIKVNGLVKKYGSKTVVNKLSFEVKPGEIIGFLGPNGSGKTTTIEAIIGRINYNQGEIKIFDKDFNKLSKADRRKIGIVPQKIALFSDLTVRDNAIYFARLYGLSSEEAKKRSNDLLLELGLDKQKNNRVSKFSGGQRTRLNILCGIIHKPDLLFLDEPTVAIDPQTRNLILNLIKKLANEGTTIIYTSHYMEEVEYLCNKVIIIDEGRVIAEGTKEELLSLVGNKKIIQFTSYEEVELVKNTLNSCEIVTNVINHNSNYDVYFEGDKQIIEDLLEGSLKYSNLRLEQPNLQSIFIELTGRSLRD